MQFVSPSNGLRGLELLTNSPVFDFPSGRSRFLALVLPDTPKGTLILYPAVSGETSESSEAPCERDKPRIRRIVPPAITWLDGMKSPLRTDLTPQFGPKGFIFSRPAEARFAVLHVNASALGQQFVMDTPVTTEFSFQLIGAAVIPIPHRSGGRTEYKGTATGRLLIGLE